MTLRITLLVLVTGLFSLVWIQDRQSWDVADSDPTRRLTPLGSLDNERTRTKEAGSITSRPSRKPLSLHWWEKFDRMTARDSADAVQRQINVAWKRSYRRTRNALRRWTKKQFAAFSRGFRNWAAHIAQQSRRESAPIQMVSAKTSTGKKTQRGIENILPLPAGIIPGEYRAVSNTGIVRQLTLSLDQLDHRGRRDFEARDVYQSQSRGLCWFFIRVQSENETIRPAVAEPGRDLISPAMAEKRPTPHAPAIAESGPDRGVQKQAGEIIVQTGRRIIEGMSAILENRNEPAEKMERLLKSPLRISKQETDNDRL